MYAFGFPAHVSKLNGSSKYTCKYDKHTRSTNML